MESDIMAIILAMATAITGVTSGVVQVIKTTGKVPKELLPFVALVIGILLGAAATFIDIPIAERLWAGGISGLAAVGFFESIKKEDKQNG